MSKPVKADPAMFAPCPKPVTSEKTPEESAALAQGLRQTDNPAEWAFVRLTRLIKEFESRLDTDDEVGVRGVGLPGDGVLAIHDLGFWGPDMLLFFGRDPDGRPVTLVQHVSRLNVVLSARTKPQPDQPARRIGFRLDEMVREREGA